METLKGCKEEVRSQKQEIATLQEQLGDSSKQAALQAELEETRRARDDAEMG